MVGVGQVVFCLFGGFGIDFMVSCYLILLDIYKGEVVILFFCIVLL